LFFDCSVSVNYDRTFLSTYGADKQLTLTHSDDCSLEAAIATEFSDLLISELTK